VAWHMLSQTNLRTLGRDPEAIAADARVKTRSMRNRESGGKRQATVG